MAWISRQPRLTQIYCFVVGELNDIGIKPGGNEIKPWIRQEMRDEGIEADKSEITTILTGLIQEKAITQADVNRLMTRAKVLREH
jgi:hypothetical protein